MRAFDIEELAECDWPGVGGQFLDQDYQHSLGYATAAAARIGAQARFLAVRTTDGALVGAAALRHRRIPGLRRGIGYVAAGPLVRRCDADEPPSDQIGGVLTALRRRVVTEEGNLLRLRFSGTVCRDPAEWDAIAASAGFRPTQRVQHYRSFALDLSQDEDARRATLDPKWRSELRTAEKRGMAVETGDGRDPALRRRFAALFDDVKKIKDFDTDQHPDFYCGIDTPDFDLEISIASRDGVDLGGVVAGGTRWVRTYLFGATNEEGRKARAGYLLTWRAVQRARERGCLWYDLGGVDEAANPGVHRFKKRMGGPEIVAGGPFEAAPSALFRTVIETLEDGRRVLRRGQGR